MLPRGLRNFNPGNLRPSNPPWNGTVGADGGFAIFDGYVNGIRALCKQLIAYQDRRSIYTVRQAITTWAPPSDNNDTEAYITAVCHMLECKPNDRFDFKNKDFLFWMATAIGLHENGPVFFEQVSDADIESGVAAALT